MKFIDFLWMAAKDESPANAVIRGMMNLIRRNDPAQHEKLLVEVVTKVEMLWQDYRDNDHETPVEENDIVNDTDKDKRIKELEEALRPFAEFGVNLNLPPTMQVHCSLNASSYQTATKVLKSKKPSIIEQLDIMRESGSKCEFAASYALSYLFDSKILNSTSILAVANMLKDFAKENEL